MSNDDYEISDELDEKYEFDRSIIRARNRNGPKNELVKLSLDRSPPCGLSSYSEEQYSRQSKNVWNRSSNKCRGRIRVNRDVG